MNKQYQVIKGAIEADTNKFILPQFGLKGIHYKCFDKTCKMPVIKVGSYVKKDGTKIFDYFRHNKLTDEEECKCKRYSRNTRLNDFEIHKEGVMNLNYLLENNKIDKRLIRYCTCCLKSKLINKEVEKLQDNEQLETEYLFKHNGRNLRADIARLRDGKIYQIYEIKYSHVTREEDRPNDIEWYEIDAQDINKQLEQMENFDDREIILSCQRINNLCPNCIKNKEKLELEMKEALDRLREEEIRCNAERERKRLIKMKEDEDKEELKLLYKQSTEKQMLKQKQDEERRSEWYKAKTEEQAIKNKQIRKQQAIQREEQYKQHREEDKQQREIKNKQREEEEKLRNINKYSPEQLAKFKEYDELQAKIRVNFTRIGLKY